jgi:predicted ATP-dependent endonuclease of OLD family
MYIKKIVIKNFKSMRQFTVELNKNINIIVGDNEAGKSTIIEAIHLALSGVLNGRYLNNKLNEYVFNKEAVRLRDSVDVPVDKNYAAYNFEISKGLSFDRVLIYPTKNFLEYLKN